MSRPSTLRLTGTLGTIGFCRPTQPKDSLAFHLPVELLRIIFVLGLSETPSSFADGRRAVREYQLAVSSACSYWRSAALETPQLWSLIHLQLSGISGETLGEETETILTRSGEAALDLRIAQTVRDDQLSYHHFYLLKWCLPRAAACSFRIHPDMAIVAYFINCGGAPRLRNLQLIDMGHNLFFDESFSPESLISYPLLMSLNRVLLGDTVAHIHLLPPTLRSLEIHNAQKALSMQNSDFMETLTTQCPDLEVLRLTGLSTNESTYTALPPRLRTLFVQYCMSPGPPLPLWNCSALVHLAVEVRDTCWDLSVHLPPSHIPTLERLRTLALRLGARDELASMARSMLRLTPNLRALDVRWSTISHLLVSFDPESFHLSSWTRSEPPSGALPAPPAHGLPLMPALRLLRITVLEDEFLAKNAVGVKTYCHRGMGTGDDDVSVEVLQTAEPYRPFAAFLVQMRAFLQRQIRLPVGERVRVEWWVEEAPRKHMSVEERAKILLRSEDVLSRWAPPWGTPWFRPRPKEAWMRSNGDALSLAFGAKAMTLTSLRHFARKIDVADLAWTEL